VVNLHCQRAVGYKQTVNLLDERRPLCISVNSRVASMCSPLIKNEARFDLRAVTAANFSFAWGTSIGPAVSVP